MTKREENTSPSSVASGHERLVEIGEPVRPQVRVDYQRRVPRRCRDDGCLQSMGQPVGKLRRPGHPDHRQRPSRQSRAVVGSWLRRRRPRPTSSDPPRHTLINPRPSNPDSDTEPITSGTSGRGCRTCTAGFSSFSTRCRSVPKIVFLHLDTWTFARETAGPPLFPHLRRRFLNSPQLVQIPGRGRPGFGAYFGERSIFFRGRRSGMA